MTPATGASWHPQGKTDLLEIGAFIAKDSPMNATKFLLKLHQKVQLVSERPGIGKQVKSKHLPTGARRAKEGNYYIYYQANPNGKTTVLRIVNRYRNQSLALSRQQNQLQRSGNPRAVSKRRDSIERSSTQQRKQKERLRQVAFRENKRSDLDRTF